MREGEKRRTKKKRMPKTIPQGKEFRERGGKGS